MSDWASGRAAAGAAAWEMWFTSIHAPTYRTNDVATGDQSGLPTTEMRLLGHFSVISQFSLLVSLQHLQSIWIRRSAEEKASKWGMLGLY